MSYYAETDYPELTSDQSSLIVAFANLLKDLGYDQNPPSVQTILQKTDPIMGWYALPRVYDGFSVEQMSTGDVWPLDRHAIVCQRRLDQKAAGMVEHYSLVSDPHAGTIVDSLDGTIKHASVYGGIVGWASYLYDGEEEAGAESPETATLPENVHVLKENENLWDVARDKNVPAQKLIDMNELDDPAHLPVGTEILLPLTTKKDRPEIEYKVLAKPHYMHVTKPGGTTKWRFGHVRVWADIRQESRHYDEKQNIEIYAVAKVPVEGEIAAYYMDRHDLGSKFDETGRPSFTRGFNWQHLGEGKAPEVKTPDLAAEAIAAAMLEDDRLALPEHLASSPAPAIEAPMTPQPEEPTVDTPQDAVAIPGELAEDYKDTFKYINVEESPERFRLLETIDIREMDGARPPLQGKRSGDIFLARGWFMHQGTPYYRLDTRHWYAIPTQYAQNIEDEEFNDVDVDLPTKIAHGLTLTKEEQRLATIARGVARYNKLRNLTSLLRRK
jgi:hypothetical protein